MPKTQPEIVAALHHSLSAAEAKTRLAKDGPNALAMANLSTGHLGAWPWFYTLPNTSTITVGQLPHRTSWLPADEARECRFSRFESAATTVRPAVPTPRI